jgi:predicted TIM-barrel fold metal-dependent hydrolase
LLIPKIEEYPDIQFILLHSGHEFLPPDSPYYYDFKFSDKSIAMAKAYPNVYLSMSAVFAQEPDGTLKYPGGEELVNKMKHAEVTQKVFWASDASYKQGQIRPVLITALRAMIKAGWTQEERVWALNGCARHVFKIPAKAVAASAPFAN